MLHIPVYTYILVTLYTYPISNTLLLHTYTYTHTYTHSYTPIHILYYISIVEPRGYRAPGGHQGHDRAHILRGWYMCSVV